MFFVLKKPFRYAVAGYGVFNCVNGGVIKKTETIKRYYLGVKISQLFRLTIPPLLNSIYVLAAINFNTYLYHYVCIHKESSGHYYL